MSKALSYTISQPTRGWFEGDEEGQLLSADGLHEITMDPVYGYYRLTTVEDPCESITESLSQYEVVMYAETFAP